MRLVPAVASSSKRPDLLVRNLSGQKPGHLGVVPQQMQFYLDRLIQQAFERLYRWRLSWRFLHVRSMLGVHERGSFLGDDSANELPENPLSFANLNEA